MEHADPRATSQGIMMHLFFSSLTSLSWKSQTYVRSHKGHMGFLGAMQQIVCANGLRCCFDPSSSVQSEKEESSRKSESICCFFFFLHHWHIESMERGGEEVADRENCFSGVITAREGLEETSLGPIFLLPPVTSKSNEPNLQIKMRFFLLTSLKA